MQEIRDIFRLWDSLTAMAKDLGEKPDTVRKWRARGRIPEAAWGIIIEKAAKREVLITAAQLLALNGPIKRRGTEARVN